jgi:alanine racemase/UDP-N-acetylmuramoyl-tripeptide--D-alanyl-D-alanine ligase
VELFDLRNWKGYQTTNRQTSTPVLIDQVAIDSRRIHSKQALFVALSGLNFDGHTFVRSAYRAGARYAVVRHDFALDDTPDDLVLIKVDDPLHALQEIAELVRKERKTTVVAVTGSYGKTMLKDLLTQILKEQFITLSSPESFNSQIGVALSLLKIQNDHQIAIIEAAISKPGEMNRLTEMIQPDHVIITNVEKQRIQNREATAIAYEKLKLIHSKVKWALVPSHSIMKDALFGRDGVYFWDAANEALPTVTQHSMQANGLSYEITFPQGERVQGTIADGQSYVADLIQLAARASFLLGVSPENIAKALAKYIPEPMRIEVFKSQIGCTIINDTYTQDPMSCDVALRQMESLEEPSNKPTGKKIFLFGGLRPPIDHIECDMARIAQSIAKHKVHLVILSQPQSAAQLLSHLSLVSPATEVIVCKDMPQAIEAAKKQVQPSDVLLIKGAVKIPLSELIANFEGSPPNNQVIINLAVIQSNIEEIRARIGKNTRIMVMVKALAYGTDDIRIAKFLKSCDIDILGVSYVDEGVSMRQAGVTQNIFVLNAAEYEAQKAVAYDLEVGVSESGLINALQKYAALAGKKIRVHLHVDTGMNRFGCRPEQVLDLCKEIVASPNLVFYGMMTHFAAADDPAQDAFTIQQANLLQTAIDTAEKAGFYPRYKHACNSSATIRFGFSQFNMIRIGLAAYGLHTSKATKINEGLRPAISLVSRVVGINECKRGDTVSYGRSFMIDSDTARLAVLPIGYYDGLHRNYSGKGYCLIRGQKAQMVGKICMDYMMVDVSHIPQVKIGDPVLLFGEDDNGYYLSPEELADLGGSIVHELMTCLGPRIRRFFIYDESLRPR